MDYFGIEIGRIWGVTRNRVMQIIKAQSAPLLPHRLQDERYSNHRR
jgi:hypothetical protein